MFSMLSSPYERVLGHFQFVSKAIEDSIEMFEIPSFSSTIRLSGICCEILF